jgi:putative ABC transport system permease protein
VKFRAAEEETAYVEILRNLTRRRVRSSLTILGIAVGIMAFTVMGGMAEKITRVIRRSETYFSHRIAIRSTGGSVQLNILSPDDIMAVRETPGVHEVETQIVLPLDETAGFELVPRALVGIDLLNFARAQRLGGADARLQLRQGRWWRPGDRQAAVLGSALAQKMQLKVGDSLKAREKAFRVIGILEETLSLPDGWALIPQADALQLMREGSSTLSAMETHQVYTHAYAMVAPEDGDRITNSLAERLRRGFLLYSPQQLSKAAGQASSLLKTAILGAGAVAVLVGALSVINTMFVAVGERTREIGIKKALGAAKADILREFLLESTLMGFVGGLFGVLLGAAVIWVINRYTLEQGTPVFLLTPRLALWGFTFSGLLGAAAGLVPAVRAANLEPVEALRDL